ncbi:MAG: hypothetical protein ABL899_00390 [Nitrospira sp.]
MEIETFKKIKEMEEKIDMIYISVEKTRTYFKWTMILTIVFLVLPFIAIALMLPSLLTTYTSVLGGI